MRFKISFPKESVHTDVVCCVGWNNSEEIFSLGDDHVLMKWNLVTSETTKVCELPADIYPIDLHSFSRNQGKKQGVDQLLVTSSDGRFHLLGKNGRIEKSVIAHKGAALVGRWSHDGASLLTAGEDGQVKIWSRSGMLRSTVVQGSSVVYSTCWSPDSTHILYTSGKTLVIKPLAPNTKANCWKAHDGIVLKVAWNYGKGLIVSGGEDCKYKVWDSYGRLFYSSFPHEYPITALAWSPLGDLFCVGSYNTLRLCDRAGWSHCLEKPPTGSIYSLAWSSDGTQVAGACANRSVILAHVIERRLEWKNIEAVMTGRKTIMVRDVNSDAKDKLELPERIIHLALGYKRLVVITPAQCYVYLTSNLNTPIIIELKEGCVSVVILAEKHFLIVEKSSMGLYSYEGRLISTPKWPASALSYDSLNVMHITLSPETIALRDNADDKVIHLYETSGDGSTVSFSHTLGVMEIALSQAGSAADRQLALIDRNRDLFIATVVARGSINRKIEKLGVMVQSMCWNSSVNMLAGIQDTALTVWYYPSVLFSDQRLTRRTTVMKDATEFGKSPSVVSFEGSHIGVRRSDGALINSCISSHITILHGYTSSNLWQDALRLCRALKDETIWACLAAMAVKAKHLTTAEEAYAAINQVDKVAYIQHIKKIPLPAAQLAEMSLLGGNVQDAESLLLQNGLVFRAIMTNLLTHNWNRALELAVKHKTHVDTVLLHRKQYLSAFDKTETNRRFMQFTNEVDLDEDKIEQKIAFEYEKEKSLVH
ncbi:hypothetical protein LSTR_LSTR006392 [Laodelphax striatellus]|uniref:Intraflagellar transport protein 80 homolog n=1 Tax=Laodelphax striatellus TaxID=195883 RepID=A0A482WWX5_LAOST|nr:hypothetical protein LSTR_LSTR006392 [Laodelphax striatellus]